MSALRKQKVSTQIRLSMLVKKRRARCLLANGESVLSSAVQAQVPDFSEIKRLLEWGADPNAKDESGLKLTPLHHAAKRGHRKIIELLLPRADLSVVDQNGYTPLMTAISWGQPRAAILLMRRCRNLNQKDGVGRSVMVIAIHAPDSNLALSLFKRSEFLRGHDWSAVKTFAEDNGKGGVLAKMESVIFRLAVCARPKPKKTMVLAASKTRGPLRM